jgi:hypothetical protein
LKTDNWNDSIIAGAENLSASGHRVGGKIWNIIWKKWKSMAFNY